MSLAEPTRFAFAKGRVAFHAILEALEIGPGDQVLLPGYTCVVVPNAIRYRGAEPIFLDIDPATYNLDPALVASERGRSWDPERARAIVVQHTYGIPAEYDALAKLAGADGLAIVEDSCHALESTYRGRPVGTLGDAAFFSTQWSKPVTTGLGGWGVARDAELEAKLRRVWEQTEAPSLPTSAIQAAQYLAYAVAFRPALFWPARDLYRRLSATGLLVGSSTAEDFGDTMPAGYRRRMSRWQEMLTARKLRRFSRQARHARALTARYDAALAAAGLEPLALPAHLDPVLLRYPVRVKDKARALEAARERRIELGDWFLSPIHPVTERFEAYGYQSGSCPEGERASEEVVNLPLHEKVKEKDADRVAEFIREQLAR